VPGAVARALRIASVAAASAAWPLPRPIQRWHAIAAARVAASAVASRRACCALRGGEASEGRPFPRRSDGVDRGGRGAHAADGTGKRLRITTKASGR